MNINIIDTSLIDKLSELARLEFSEHEKNEIKEDLNKMLEFVNKLSEVDVSKIDPLVYLTDSLNIMRTDESQKVITQKQALKNAPDSDSDYFKVPKVIDNK